MKAYVASHLKYMNRKTVYDLLLTSGRISKAEISRQTSISQPTVNKIISYYLQRQIVTETGEGDTPIGRKPQLLQFNPRAFFSVGVDFEGNFLKIGIVDLLGNSVAYEQCRVSPRLPDILCDILPARISKMIFEAGIPYEKVLGIGIGLSGVVDSDNLTIDYAPFVGISSKQDYTEYIAGLRKKTGLPVCVENDANAAAIGEFIVRKLGAEDDLVYVSIGTGLGAGIILNGRIRHGVHHYAGEIGYMVFDKDFRATSTQPGWLESGINRQTFRLTQQADGQSPDAAVRDCTHYERQAIIDRVAPSLALGIANILTAVDVNRVVIGGMLIELSDGALINKVNEYLAHYCPTGVKCERAICREPAVVGSASLIRNRMIRTVIGE